MAANLSDSEPEAFPGALEQLYERYRAELRRFFRLNGRRPQGVDDLMQDMFLALLSARPSTELRNARNYLFQVAWNVLHTATRRAQRESRRLIACDPQELDAQAGCANQLWLEDDTSTDVTQSHWESVLSELPRTTQLAVLRHYRDGRTYQEIAVELGCTTHTVKKYISKALNHFRLHFSGDPEG